jgi:CheY-like chemotaxis protein
VDQRPDDEMHAVDASNEWPEDAASSTDRTVTEAVPKKVVLVVEDDDAVSSLLVALLEDRGYQAIPAMDGQTAIELARKHVPHLITLESLKADPRTREIPVVVISAFTQILPAGDRKKLAYLLGKPFDVTEVLAVVQATVGNPFV